MLVIEALAVNVDHVLINRFTDLSAISQQPARHQAPIITPNTITVVRLILVPVIIWLLATGETQWAFAAFVVAGASDAADGFIAKRYQMQTELGAYLDPIADKALIVCIFVMLGLSGSLPVWLVVAVVARDVLIVMAVLLSWMLANPVAMKPHPVSKANTAAQIVLAATVLGADAFGLKLEILRWLLVWITGALTLASLATYLASWLRHMSEPNVPL